MDLTQENIYLSKSKSKITKDYIMKHYVDLPLVGKKEKTIMDFLLKIS